MITFAFADCRDGKKYVEWSEDCGWSDEEAYEYAHTRGSSSAGDYSQRYIWAENFISEAEAKKKYPEYF